MKCNSAVFQKYYLVCQSHCLRHTTFKFNNERSTFVHFSSSNTTFLYISYLYAHLFDNSVS